MHPTDLAPRARQNSDRMNVEQAVAPDNASTLHCELIADGQRLLISTSESLG